MIKISKIEMPVMYGILNKKFQRNGDEINISDDGENFEDIYFNFSEKTFYYRFHNILSKNYGITEGLSKELRDISILSEKEEDFSLEIEDKKSFFRVVSYYDTLGKELEGFVIRQIVKPPVFSKKWKTHPNIIRMIGNALESRENFLISGVPGSGKTTFISSILEEANQSEDMVIKNILNERILHKQNIFLKPEDDIDNYLKTVKSLLKLDDDKLKDLVQGLLSNPISEFYSKFFKNKLVFTIEKPIEWRFESKNVKFFQKETKDFHKELTKTLRSNPDIIFIQEIRRPEEYETFLQAGMNGIPAFSTNHSGSVFKNLEKIVNFDKGNINLKANITNGLSLLINLKRYKNEEDIFLVSYEYLYINEKIGNKFIVEDDLNVFKNNVITGNMLDKEGFDKDGNPLGKPCYVSHAESLLYTLYLHYAQTKKENKIGELLTLQSGTEVFQEMNKNQGSFISIQNNLITYYDFVDKDEFMEFMNIFKEKYLTD